MVGSSSGKAKPAALDDDITPDDDNEPNDLDGGDDDIKDLLEEDKEDNIADKVLLMFFFDLESTGGSTYSDCIMELAAKIIGVPNSVVLMQRHYSSLVHTSRDINAVSKRKVGLSTAMLKRQPPFAAALEGLLSWIGDSVNEMDEWQSVNHYPLLVAHNGFVFDFMLVLSELERRDMSCSGFRALNVHFADTLYDCRLLSKSKEKNVFSDCTKKKLRGLSIENLYAKYFPGEAYNAHRAYAEMCPQWSAVVGNSPHSSKNSHHYQLHSNTNPLLISHCTHLF